MRIGSMLKVAIAAGAAAASGVPAAAETLAGSVRILPHLPRAAGSDERASAALAAPGEAPAGRVGLAYAVSGRMDLFVGLKPPKDKAAGERPARWANTSAARPNPPRAMKVGVLIRW